VIYVYNFFIYLGAIIASPFILILLAFNKKWMQSLPERFGFISRERLEELRGKKVVWFHAASAGEVQALAPVVKEFKLMKPDRCLLVTTTSMNGRKKIEKELQGIINCAFLLPLDIDFIIKGAVNAVNPEALVVVETELWPNLLNIAHEKKIPVIMINGRISIKSFRVYYAFKFFFSWVLNRFDLLIVQSEKMLLRLKRLGVTKKKIIIMNNTKYSFEIDSKRADEIRNADKKGRTIVVAGSIREGEEETVIKGFVSSGVKNAVLVIAPRHLNRVGVIEKILGQSGLKYALWSSFKDYARITQYDAVIVNTIGELSYIYTAGDVAIIGGGFMKFGGHNPMEAAAAGLPLIMGKYMFNFEDTADQFTKNGGAYRAQTALEIAEKLKLLLTDKALRLANGEQNKKIVERFRGSASTTAMLIDEVLIDFNKKTAVKG
jgi:3-deoxy-D-manno-octulosonic-acid transferase